MNVSVHFVQQWAFQGWKCLKEKASPGKTALRGTWRQAQEKRDCSLERFAIESLRFYG